MLSASSLSGLFCLFVVLFVPMHFNVNFVFSLTFFQVCKYRVSLFTTRRYYQLSAPTDDEMEEWMNVSSESNFYGLNFIDDF